MAHKTQNPTTHKPNYLAIGMILGACFMVAMETPAFFVLGLSIGIALDRQRSKRES